MSKKETNKKSSEKTEEVVEDAIVKLTMEDVKDLSRQELMNLCEERDIFLTPKFNNLNFPTGKFYESDDYIKATLTEQFLPTNSGLTKDQIKELPKGMSINQGPNRQTRKRMLNRK